MDRYYLRFFILWLVTRISFCQECSRQLHLLQPGRHCQKPCRNNYACVGSDECICDNLCGFSCFDRRLHCNPFKNILHGLIIGEGHVYGAIRTFRCKAGYRLSRRVMLVCRSDRRWSGVQPRCIPMLCSNPPEIRNGYIHSMSKFHWTVGEKVIYRCNHGYDFKYPHEKTYEVCEESGRWSSFNQRCVLQTAHNETVRCDSPPDVANGWIENDRNVGDPNLDNDGTSVSSNVFHSPTSSIRIRWRPDDVIVYRCKKGFKLVGGGTRRICRSDGQWTATQPRCENVHSRIVCSSPIPPPNGRILPERNFIWVAGDSFTVQCIDGFEVSSYNQIFCTPNGAWNDDIPNCIEKFCGTPSKILNGWLEKEHALNFFLDNIHNSIQYGNIPSPLSIKLKWRQNEVIRYRCKIGFRLNDGDEKRTCRSDGTWTGVQPSCIHLHCQKPPKPINGFIEPSYKQDWKVGDKLYYFCHQEYKFEYTNGHTRQVSRLCQRNLEWSASLPKCVMRETSQPVYCRTPQPFRNGWIESDNNMDESSHNNVLNNLFRPVTVNVQWRPDDLIIYKCKTNYILTKGSKRRICKSDGQWTGMHPRCIESIPEVIYEGNIQTGKITGGYGSRNTNELNTTAETDEVPAGRLSPVLNIVVVGCDSPPRIKNGWIESDRNIGTQIESSQISQDSVRVKWHVDDTILYQCESGYKLDGNHRSICRSDGKWTGKYPRCISKREKCPPPIVSPYGAILPLAKTTWASGDSLIMQCNHGYQVSNTNKVYCTNGKWSSAMPTCIQYPSNEQNCQSWTKLSDGKYYISTQRYFKKSSYHEAIKNCHSLGGLLTVNGVKYSAIRKELLQLFQQPVTYWIGLSDEKIERNWIWLDGSILSPNEQLLLFEYHDIFWANNRDCAFITSNLYEKWKAGSCTYDRHYAICERDWCGEMNWKQSIYPKGYEGIILQGPLLMDEAVRKCMLLNGWLLRNYRIHEDKYINLDRKNIAVQPRSNLEEDVEARFFSAISDWIVGLWSSDETTTTEKKTTSTTFSPTLAPDNDVITTRPKKEEYLGSSNNKQKLNSYAESNEDILPVMFCERRTQSVLSPSLGVISQLPHTRAHSSDESSGDFSSLNKLPNREETSLTRAPPVVHCGYDAITITVNNDVIHDNNSEREFLYLAPDSAAINLTNISPSCLFSRFDLALALYSVQIPLPFVDCGTSMEYLQDNVVFKNKIWRSRGNENSVFEINTIIAEFNCVYDNFYHVSAAIDAICCDIPLLISSKGIFSFRSSLWQDPPPLDGLSILLNGQERRKIHSMTGVVSYSVGEMIYITVDMNRGGYGNGLQPIFQKCWVSTNKTSEMAVPGSDFVLYPISETSVTFSTWGPKTIRHSAHFGFELLHARESMRIYLHCNVKVILKNEIAKRSLEVESGSKLSHLTKGPIHYYPLDTSQHVESPTPFYLYRLLAVCGLGLMITVLIVSCCIVNFHVQHHSKYQPEYFPSTSGESRFSSIDSITK